LTCCGTRGPEFAAWRQSIPLTISEGTNIRAIDARISYDPTLLNSTAATLGPDAPAGASVILNNSTPGLAIVVYFATAPLPVGAGTFVNLQASVPTDNASENYRRQQVLDVHDVIVSDGNDNESPVIENDALQVTTFFADVSANGRINAADAAQVARIAALLDGGFLGTPSTDPGLVGDISGNGRLNAADASLVAQFAALIPVSQIPAIPGGVVIAARTDLGPGLPGVATLPSRLVDYSSSPRVDDSSDSSEGSTDKVSEGDIEYLALDRAMAEFGDSEILGDSEELELPLADAIDELLSSGATL
jgi:hypothetical protein